MKTLIICVSTHHGNTEKVAGAMADVLNAKVVKPEDVGPKDLEQYDLVDFGSGIYMDKPHRTLLEFVEKLPDQNCRKAFIFSTSGLGNGPFSTVPSA
ncbi:MAG: flavodoxin domain-containing protein [Candidatus Bilamarchaeaceae archaeon]